MALLGGVASGCQLLGYEPVAFRDSHAWEEPDATTPNLDATTPVPADARSDSSDAISADSACRTPNACGGCSELTNQPAQSCGSCGLGTYACEGSELLCVGGDATPAAGSSVLIDDWETEDVVTAYGDGHTYAFSDGTGTLIPSTGTSLTPTPGGAANSTGCAHVYGKDFETFGAGLIVRLNSAGCTYDASIRRGLGFWIKGTAPQDVYFAVATAQTKRKEYCGEQCDDHYGTMLPVTSEWTHHTLQWTDLHQAGWGAPVAFDATQIEYIQYSFGTHITFDFYLDELNFY